MAVHDSFSQQLCALLKEGSLQGEEPLSQHTTFQIGGPAQWLVTPCAEDEVLGVAALCHQEGMPLHVLGSGSNVLVADEGVRGVVLKLAEGFAEVTLGEDGCIQAQAGAANEHIAAVAQQAGLAGFEFASGIPGTIGGAAVMNAGAYGGQLSDVAQWVRCLTPKGEVRRISAEEAHWGYRQSLMMEEGYLVLEVGLNLTPDDPAAIQERMDDLRQRREEKQPLDMPSAGSTFKRPEGHFAGKLIQDAGMQGCRIGGAQVSSKHAGFIVNCGGATAQDVRQLIQAVQERVRTDAGILLEPEVRQWGFPPASRVCPNLSSAS